MFPENPRFYWVVKILGQNLLLEGPNKMDILGCYKYAANLEVENVAIAVHCAMDTELDDHILFWNPNRVSKSFGNVKPAELYHVGLIPGVANLTYVNANKRNFSFVQLYSRFFAGCHRDANNMFMTNGVAKSLYNRYLTKMSNAKPAKFNLKDKFLNDIDGKMTVMLNGLRDCCAVTTAARIECVWSKSFTQVDDADIRRVILNAFADFETCLNDNENPFFRNDMLVDFPCQQIAERIVPWITVFGNTVTDLTSKFKLFLVSEKRLNNHKLIPNANIAGAVLAVEQETQLWTMDPQKIIPIEKFGSTQVAEFLLHYLIKGKPHKSYPNGLGNANNA